MKGAKKYEQTASLLNRLCAEYLERESDIPALVTVTRVLLSDDRKYATILLTAYPQETETQALDFAKRHLSDLRRYVGERARMRQVPFLRFAIDQGEKHRRRIDDISRETGGQQRGS